jgi:hypothetical protein
MKKRNLRLFKALLFTLVLLSPVVGSATAVAAPQSASEPWWGEYYDNLNLGGAPIITRYDDAINFGWGSKGPGAGIPNDNFSARWTREAWFDGGTYRFKVLSDDGVRLWVGDQLVVDEWQDRLAVPLYIDRYISAGTYRVTIEYYEHWGDATCAIGWNRVVGGETWIGEYFDNRKLDGSPVYTRNDNAIDFDWDSGSPDPAVPADKFSVRWTRVVEFDAGTYRFLTSTDDGVRVWVDGGLVVDAWYDQKLPNTRTGEVYLAAGRHTITVEYYEHKDKAHAHVWWQLREPSLPQPGYWHGQYFDNPNFVGGPALERDDAEINFDWGVEPPVSWMPDDNFSIRWTRTVDFTPGYYRFAVLADDGVRIWLDYGIIIDKWQDMDYELHYVDGTYLQGQHTIKVEYYEHTGHARVRFWWESSAAGNAPPTYVPAPPAAAPAAGTAPADDDPWQATYFASADLSGEPVLTRIETALDHNWGFGSPGPTVPVDDFSARWTQSLYLPAGTYRFTTYTDDGVRLWVDGRLLVNSWYPMRGYRSATVWLGEGPHEVRMEYYERGGVALARLTWQRLY